MNTPIIIDCPFCKRQVSARAVNCESCGTTLNEVPRSVTVEWIDSLRDEDLPMCLYWYVLEVIDEHPGQQGDGPSDAEILEKLPRGIRAGYTLIVLSSEVSNGGFQQWFTNSSGKIVNETLEDLRLIGAMHHARIVEQAIRLNERVEDKHPAYKDRWTRSDSCEVSAALDAYWSDWQANFEPDCDRLTTEFIGIDNDIDDPDAIWNHLARYVRQHLHELSHQRDPTKPPMYG